MHSTPHHDYNWLFGHLAAALQRAQTDPEFNVRYGWYRQRGSIVQWPTEYMLKLTEAYNSKTGLQLNVGQLKTKISNARLKSFHSMVEKSPGWAKKYWFVMGFDPSALQVSHEPDPSYFPEKEFEKIPEDFIKLEPSSTCSAIRDHRPGPPPQQHRPIQGRVEDITAHSLSLAEILKQLDTLTTQTGALCTIMDSIPNSDLRMAYVLDQHLKTANG